MLFYFYLLTAGLTFQSMACHTLVHVIKYFHMCLTPCRRNSSFTGMESKIQSSYMTAQAQEANEHT